ncbi:MAG TPA: hypothetical protein VIG48_02735 [Jatrophihabitans sp.]|jgi:hypothetical protein
MSKSQPGRVETLAQHLLQEGHVDNEADARLAAIQILLVQGEPLEDSPAPAG